MIEPYVGIRFEHGRKIGELMMLNSTPRRDTVDKTTGIPVGEIYTYLLGPFDTIHGASWFISNVQTPLAWIDDMERAAELEMSSTVYY